MSNDSSRNARQTSKHAGLTGDSYKVLNGYKTQVVTEGDKIRICFHDTPVVTFDHKTIELDTGGWRTRSTKARMNQSSQEFELGFRVFQKQDDWFVEYQNDVLPFIDNELLLKRPNVTVKGGEKNA